LIAAVLEAIRAGHVRSAHDCSEGGLAVALAESCIADPNALRGLSVDLSAWSALPLRALLFGEAQGRIVISAADAAPILRIAKAHGVPARTIGKVTRAAEGFTITTGTNTLHASVAPLAASFHEALPRAMSRTVAVAEPAVSGGVS
jgi:phosphoribosylformylglycinamidine synthase